jgi:hypothetical protein
MVTTTTSIKTNQRESGFHGFKRCWVLGVGCFGALVQYPLEILLLYKK